jgi:hypothetical protein
MEYKGAATMAAPTTPSNEQTAAMQAMWDRAVAETKRQATSPALFRALERTVPVAWEDDTFVIGFNTMDGQMGAQLNTSQNQLLMERVLRTLTGSQNLKLRVVEGTQYTDWLHAKQRDMAAEASRVQFVQKKVAETNAFGSWDDIHDRVSRLWATAEHRNLATGRGRYIDQSLELLSTAMDTLYPEGEKAPEPVERGLARVIERIATNTNSDPAAIAYFLFERRKAKPAQ